MHFLYVGIPWTLLFFNFFTNEPKKARVEHDLVSDRELRKLEASIEEKIKSAEKNHPATDGLSNPKKIASIRENRNKEKAEERKNTAFRPKKQKNEKLAEVIPIEKQEDNYQFPDSVDELFEEDD